MSIAFDALLAALKADSSIKVCGILHDDTHTEERVIYLQDGKYRFRSVVDGDPDHCTERDQSLEYPTLRSTMEFVLDDWCTCFE